MDILQSGIEGDGNKRGEGSEKSLKVNKQGVTISGGGWKNCIYSVASCGNLVRSFLT